MLKIKNFLESIKPILPYLILIIFILIIRTFLVTTYNVDGISMEPSLKNKDKLLVSKMYDGIEKGDLVIIRKGGKDYIKRVIGLPSSKVFINRNNKQLSIDKEKINCCENYLFKINKIYYQEISIPQHQYFVLGDNYGESIDSRVFGFVTEDEIVGKVIFRYWPLFNK